jgi:hypothetical protein
MLLYLKEIQESHAGRQYRLQATIYKWWLGVDIVFSKG